MPPDGTYFNYQRTISCDHQKIYKIMVAKKYYVRFFAVFDADFLRGHQN